MITLGRFVGDGRIKLQSIAEQPKGAKPVSIRRALCRHLIENFESGGYGDTYSSHTGGTLWVITEYCDINSIPYELKQGEFCGWTVIRSDK